MRQFKAPRGAVLPGTVLFMISAPASVRADLYYDPDLSFYGNSACVKLDFQQVGFNGWSYYTIDYADSHPGGDWRYVNNCTSKTDPKRDAYVRDAIPHWPGVWQLGASDLYYLVALPDNQGEPEHPCGNPVDVVTGNKFQQETDIPALRSAAWMLDRGRRVCHL
jgi:hypothetical protein